MRKQVTLAEFQKLAKAQGVPKEDMAFVCPVCGTIQSARDLIATGAGKTFEEVEKYIAFSCVGRWTKAGPYQPEDAPGKGCDWTLGGLFQMYTLEVVTPDGGIYPRFEPATPEEAKKHLAEPIKIPNSK